MDFLDLPLIWAGLLAVAVFMYIALDGFDLGVGILFPFAEKDEDRDVMMNSVAPFWDGNETWLVLGGGGLFAAFPLAYAALMPAIYMPIGFMLVALIFRGVAFEFRFKAVGSGRRLWDQAFHWGSVVATFAQGLVLGALVQGIALDGNYRFAGGMFDWLTPFSFVTGCALIWGYALLGAGWLVIKTEGRLQDWCRRAGMVSAVIVLVMILVVSLWAPALDAGVASRWGLNYPEVDWGRLMLWSPIPVVVAIAFWRLIKGFRGNGHYGPYLWALAIFFLGYTGLMVGIYPYLVPYALTFEQAAAAPNAQGLLLVGAVILLPVILGYTAYVYWLFRGKVTVDAGYH